MHLFELSPKTLLVFSAGHAGLTCACAQLAQTFCAAETAVRSPRIAASQCDCDARIVRVRPRRTRRFLLLDRGFWRRTVLHGVDCKKLSANTHVMISNIIHRRVVNQWRRAEKTRTEARELCILGACSTHHGDRIQKFLHVTATLLPMQAQGAQGSAVCPVVPHAPNQPLPPGHPDTGIVPPSSLQPPSGEHCIFFRTPEDVGPAAGAPDAEIRPSTEAIVDAIKASPAHSAHPDSLLVLSSRSSALAKLQADQVANTLAGRYGVNSPAFVGGDESASLRAHLANFTPEGKEPSPMTFPVQAMSTAGDANLRSPLYVIGGEGRAIWTKELEVALREGVVDAIVHCTKDVPTTLPDGLELAAILEREDPRDALVVKGDLPYKVRIR